MVTLAGCATGGGPLASAFVPPLYGPIAVLLQWGGVAVVRRRPRLNLSDAL